MTRPPSVGDDPALGPVQVNRRPRRPVVLPVITGLTLLFLFLPIAIVTLFSFNGADSLSYLRGFSLDWYAQAFTDDEILDSLRQSLVIAAISATVSTVFGTAVALGLPRLSKRVAGLADTVITTRLVSPETASAVALFLAFALLGVQLSLTTLLIGHVVLSLVFVVTIVRSQLAHIGGEVEDAARDLGSSAIGAICKVVLPVLIPSLMASFLLAFIISFDNFATSFYTAGIGTTPLPLWIYSSMRFGLSPVVNAIGISLLLATLLLMTTVALTIRRAGKVKR